MAEVAKHAYKALMKFYPLTLDDLPGEEWKPIPDYEDYHVSNFGRVKSFKYKSPRIIKPAFDKGGYLQVSLSKKDKPKVFRINRLVALAFIPNPEEKPEVNHIDGHPLNNHVSNLEWVTPSENQQHAVKLGLIKSGENNYQAGLTNEQVLYVRTNPLGLSGGQLATMFSVTPPVINGIQLGKTYKTAGGAIRQAKPKPPRIPDEIRAIIRAEYVYGSHEFGSRALARKYGVHQSTILNIVNASE